MILFDTILGELRSGEIPNIVITEDELKVITDALAVDINNEATARTDADTTLQNNIDTEATARTDADTTLQDNINTEEAARTAADTTLQNYIDIKATARIAADTTLQDNINTETTARTDADTTLQNNIDLKADKIGPDDIEITDWNKGVIFRSRDGTRWRTTVGNSGTLTINKVT